MERFNVSVTAAYLPLSLFTIGLAFGPIMGAPISEALGRKAVYVTTYPPALLFTMGAGLAQNFGTLLVCRFLAGTFASPALAVGAGSNSDLWKPLDRAVSGIVFLLAPFAGPALGKDAVSHWARRNTDKMCRTNCWRVLRTEVGLEMDTVDDHLDWRLCLHILPLPKGDI